MPVCTSPFAPELAKTEQMLVEPLYNLYSPIHDSRYLWIFLVVISEHEWNLRDRTRLNNIGTT
jgi:hypothetical protein